MAKKGPSKHSRAARRATSPSINTDKSLKNVKPPEESVDQRPAVLAAQHNAGVSKKAKSGRKSVMSSRARRRHEKGMDRAEAVMDRTVSKIEKSKGQARTIQSRRKAWEDINVHAKAVGDDNGDDSRPKKKTAKQLQDEAEQALVDKFYSNDGDEDMDEDESDGGETPPTSALVPGSNKALDDDDEIL